MKSFLAAAWSVSLSVLATAALAINVVGAASSQDSPEYVEMTLGNPDAKVVLTEYASFTCPHCATFHETSYPQLKKNYIDTGKVLFRIREVYQFRPGIWAAILARCGGRERYFGIVDLLFKKQASWSTPADAADVVSRLTEIGRAAGLTQDQISACFTDAENAEMLYNVSVKNQRENNVVATPSFTINGRLHSNMPYQQLADLLDEALGE